MTVQQLIEALSSLPDNLKHLPVVSAEEDALIEVVHAYRLGSAWWHPINGAVALTGELPDGHPDLLF